MQRFLAKLIFLIWFISLQTQAVTDPYLQGIGKVKERAYPEAVSLFRSQLKAFEDDLVYRNRTRVWLALSLLADDKNSTEAESMIQLVLCDALSLNTTKYFATPCPSEETWTATTQLDIDMVSAAATAYASLQWRKSNYETAIHLLSLALDRSVNAAPLESNHTPALQHLEQTQSATPEKAIDNADKQQALLRQQLFDKIIQSKGKIDPENLIDPKMKESLVNLTMSKMFAEKQKQLIAEDPNLASSAIPGDKQSMLDMVRESAQQRYATAVQKQTCIKEKAIARQQEITQKIANGELSPEAGTKQMRDNLESAKQACGLIDSASERQERAEKRKKARNEVREERRARTKLNMNIAWEPDGFYLLAAQTMCPSPDGREVQSFEDTQRITRKSVAARLEAYRGQRLESYEMVQPPVLNALKGFLDIREQLPKGISAFGPARSSFKMALGLCPDTMNLEGSFSQALLVMLTNPVLPQQTREEHLKALIDTWRRLRKTAIYPNSMSHMLEALVHMVMGNFYLRAQKPDKALPELKQAFAGFRPSEQFTDDSDMAYIPILLAAKTLQGIVAATSLPEKSRTNDLQSFLLQLRDDIKQANSQVERQLNMTQEERQNQQLQQTKKQIIQGFSESPQLKQDMETLASNLPQHGKQILADITKKMEDVKKQYLSGERDEEIRKKLSEIEATSEMKQEFIIGTTLERRYMLYNNQALILLLLSQIELDLQQPDAARRQLQEADSYVEQHNGWISERIQAYREYSSARLLAMEQKLADAAQAYRNAVFIWYHTPYSILETVYSPLESPTEIVEKAAVFSIEQGEFEIAFAYIELAREVSLKSDRLYGVLSQQELESEDVVLRKQFQSLLASAADKARSENTFPAYEDALEAGKREAEESRRREADAVYGFLNQISTIESWIETTALGQFVGNSLKQANRRQSLLLQQDRAVFIAEQMRSSKSVPVKHAVSTIPDWDLSFTKRIQQSLPNDTLLLSIWMGRKLSIITALDRERVRGGIEPSQQLLGVVTSFNRSYQSRKGYRIYEKLLKPYLDGNYNRILLIANGPLENTPFAALNTDPNRRSWLGDQYLLRSLPRAEFQLKPSRQTSESVRLLVLDGSTVTENHLATLEVDDLKKIYKSKHIMPEQLSKAEVIRQMPNYSLIHFAGHSELNSDFPDFSSLQLKDDKIYTIELEQLPLDQVHLIVLGSCESASAADASFGDPFSTLHESFLEAGVDSVLATLRKVKDEHASLLLTHFYTLLAKGYAKDEALQKAQQATRESNTNILPKDWAVFVLSGSEVAL